MEFEIRPYSNLDGPEREVVQQTYCHEWKKCLEKEQIGRVPKGLRKNPSDFKKALKSLIEEEVVRQLEIGAGIFPEGQNAVLAINCGKPEVAYHVRSVIIDVSGLSRLREWEHEGSQNHNDQFWAGLDYPNTWYLACDSGRILESHSPGGNVQLNFALTENKGLVSKRGLLEKLINHQLELADEMDLFCHTFTPMNGYRGKKEDEIGLEDLEKYLYLAFTGKIASPVGIHPHFMAKSRYGSYDSQDPEILEFKRGRIIYIFPNSRLKQDAGNMCCVTAYNGPGIKVEPGWHASFAQK